MFAFVVEEHTEASVRVVLRPGSVYGHLVFVNHETDETRYGIIVDFYVQEDERETSAPLQLLDLLLVEASQRGCGKVFLIEPVFACLDLDVLQRAGFEVGVGKRVAIARRD